MAYYYYYYYCVIVIFVYLVVAADHYNLKVLKLAQEVTLSAFKVEPVPKYARSGISTGFAVLL